MADPETVPSSFPSPQRSHRRRLFLWLALSVPVATAFAVGCFYYYLAAIQDHELQEAIAEAYRLDPDGWQLEEMEARRKMPPDERNAALVVLAAGGSMPGNWPSSPQPLPQPAPAGGVKTDPLSPGQTSATPSAPLPSVLDRISGLPPEVQLDPALVEDLRAELDKVQKARAEAARLNELTEGRFVVSWAPNPLNTVIGHHTLARRLASLVRCEAALAAQDGEADVALAAVRRNLVVGRSIGDEPTMISQLVHMALRQMAVLNLERTLAQGQPSAASLTECQRWFQKEAAEPLLLYAFRGERAQQHYLMEQLKAGNVTLSGRAPVGLSGWGESLVSSGLARRSHPVMLRLMNEAVQSAALLPEQQQEPLKRLEEKVQQLKGSGDVLFGLLLPAILRAGQSFRRDQAVLRCAVVALAAERYRLAHGRWPERLDDLVPAYLAAVPIDPFDGQRLRYKRVADGLLVYSVGPDSHDNGGAFNRKDISAVNTDLVFRLWNPAARRQTARELLPEPEDEATRAQCVPERVPPLGPSPLPQE